MIFVITIYSMHYLSDNNNMCIKHLFCSHIATMTTKSFNDTYDYMSMCLLPYI